MSTYGSKTTNMSIEHDYLSLLKRCLASDTRVTRNAVVQSTFGATLHHDFSDGFPLLTTKKMFFRGVVEELAWFLRGSTDVSELQQVGVHIWDKNTSDRSGDAGPVYGFQWRHFGAEYTSCKDYHPGGVDQIQFLLDEIKANPHSRRLFMSAWNPLAQPKMCLPPCHVSYQFYVKDNKLSCMMVQRSADVFLGLPFNIASTALLQSLIAHETGLGLGTMTIHIGDLHLYDCHKTVADHQTRRVPQILPKVSIQREKDNLWKVKASEIVLENYNHLGPLKAEMIA